MMKDTAAHRIATRAGASLLALTIAGAFTPLAGAQNATNSPAPAQTTPRPSSSATAPAQTAPVAGPGIANSTVPNNEMISGPLEPVVSQRMTPVAEEEAREGEVIVTGVRNAEASAIARKRTARTAQDSIVADDVGQFPDKNAAEAISRIAGVALDVADSGEQGGFTIRGQSADLIRIEVDGMTTLSANGDQGGRAAGVGEISSDLIKSVDVIKGQTADMTPGGVGGTVRIEQRTGLDFKKPLYRLSLQTQYNSLSQAATPRVTGIVTQKFFNDRVGVLLTGTYEEQKIGTDYSRVSVARAGYIPLGDLDNSPEKSFTTPFDPVAAAVTTKAGCLNLSTTGINSRLNCLAQWEDFVPSFVRPGRQIRGEKRYSGQARIDWRTTSNLTLFASYSPNIRKVSSQDYNWSVATPIGTTGTNGALATSNIRNVVVNANHYLTAFDMVRGTGLGFIADPSVTTQVRNIDRDLEQYYSQAGADWYSGRFTLKARVQYSLAKNQREDLAFQFYAPLQSATFRLIPETGLWTVGTPGVDLFDPASYYPVIGTTGRSTSPQLDYIPQADRNSEWNYQLDMDRRFDNLGPINRFKVGVQHRVRDNDSYREPGFLISPGLVLSRARSLDQIQACDPARAPAATPCVFGSALRSLTAANFTTSTDRLQKLHTLTVAQYQELIAASLIRLPGANFYAGAPNGEGLIQSWGTIDASTFFKNLGAYADTSAYNISCLYECIASDGKTYKRPPYHTDEITTSAYAMVDFDFRPLGMLIEGNVGLRYQRIKVNAAPVIDFSTRTATPGTGTNGLPTYIIANNLIRRESGLVNRVTEDYLPSFNIAAWPIEDKLGIRYSIARQRARPSMVQISGNSVSSCGLVDPALRDQLEQFLANNPGAIQDDDPSTDDDAEAANILNSFVNRCTGRIGNPDLKGYGAITQNLSLEWYPNKDTQLSAAVYQIDVKSGRPETVQLDGYELGGNSYLVDTYRDGPSGLTQRGFEIAGRTAFTFLPGFLRYFGGGFNYSFTKSNETNTDVDLFTGKSLPPRSESKYYYNVNLWYDDTRLSARLAYQRRAIFYDQTSGDGVNRLPPGFGYDGTAGTTSYYKFISPVYKSGTESLDGRISYNFGKALQIFAEGKNLLGTPIDKFTPSSLRDIGGGTPYMFDSLYAGRTFYAGAIITF